MRTRPAFRVALLVVALGASAAVAVPTLRQHADEQDLALTRAAAQHVTMPPGATASKTCHGSGLIGCWTVETPVHDVRDDVAAVLRPVVTGPLEVECSSVPVRAKSTTRQADECSVDYRRNGRAAFVFLRPLVDREHFGAKAVGTLVAVHDGSY